ncbi:MAG TPA: hypothetical protein VNH39_10765 [Steroidobacteraceae bacterium]|nr:hypothetical protein [Steroidobacteraceae bacterium]
MATLKKELREILERYDIDPRDKSKLWDCHGTLVLYHRAYEIIAAQEGIKFDAPVLIEANSGERIVAMLVTGHWKDRTEWSVGEAAPGNSKNAYPYAIAEKRAKDRVVAKLVGLAEHVYSEDEADEFKDASRTPAAPQQQERNATNGEGPGPAGGLSAHWADTDVKAAQQPLTPAEAAAHPTERERKVLAAREARKRITEALGVARTPAIIDEVIELNSAALEEIKDLHTPSYEAIMALAGRLKTEILASTG